MARIQYGEAAAAAFQASRELPPDALREWRAAIARYLAPQAGMRILDLGAGTGTWAATLASWYGISVVAIEPSPAMRAHARCRCMIAGHATAIPLAPATMNGAWLSTVIHHLPDLTAAACELRRVLRPGAPVLIRNAFPGRHRGIGLFRYWPEAITALNTFPSIAQVSTAFAAAGFSYVALEPVQQVTAPHSPLSPPRRGANRTPRLCSSAIAPGKPAWPGSAPPPPPSQARSSTPSTCSSSGTAAPPPPHDHRRDQPAAPDNHSVAARQPPAETGQPVANGGYSASCPSHHHAPCRHASPKAYGHVLQRATRRTSARHRDHHRGFSVRPNRCLIFIRSDVRCS